MSHPDFEESLLMVLSFGQAMTECPNAIFSKKRAQELPAGNVGSLNPGQWQRMHKSNQWYKQTAAEHLEDAKK